MKPPSRERRSRAEADVKIVSDKWSLKEKELLLKGLKRHGVSKMAAIQKEFLPHRSMDELDLCVRTTKMRAKTLLKPTRPNFRAPIEVWLGKAEDLLNQDHDYSTTLGQLLCMLGSMEPHEAKQSDADPDWGAIYRHLGELLQGRTPVEPSAIDGLVLADLLQSVSEDLGRLDSDKQRRLMQLKFDFLTRKVEIYNKKDSYEWIRKALEEDPLEEIKATTQPAQSTPNGSVDRPTTPAPASGERPHKSQLFSINPFCIPVKHLFIQPKERK